MIELPARAAVWVTFTKNSTLRGLPLEVNRTRRRLGTYRVGNASWLSSACSMFSERRFSPCVSRFLRNQSGLHSSQRNRYGAPVIASDRIGTQHGSQK